MQPMLATRGDRVPQGAEWIHEVKWDGMRVLVEVAVDGAARVFSRNENDVTVSFPELAPLTVDGRDLLIDGEVVALGGGVPSFGALADRMHVRDATRAARLAVANPVTLIAFDLLRLDRTDLCARPLSQRRALLEDLDLDGSRCQRPPQYDDGQVLLDAAREQGLEGILSKRLASPYRPGVRSRDWLKFPIRPTGSFLVGGYRHETGSDSRLGSILLGQPTPAGLVFRGRVGAGIAGRAGQRLGELLAPLVRETSVFTQTLPRADTERTIWVDPGVVVDVQYLGLTAEGRLRQPAYRGVRVDLDPASVAGADG